MAKRFWRFNEVVFQTCASRYVGDSISSQWKWRVMFGWRKRWWLFSRNQTEMLKTTTIRYHKQRNLILINVDFTRFTVYPLHTSQWKCLQMPTVRKNYNGNASRLFTFEHIFAEKEHTFPSYPTHTHVISAEHGTLKKAALFLFRFAAATCIISWL